MGMKIHMKQCDILDKEESKVIEILRRTKETKKEHGFNFCSSNRNMAVTHIEGGEKDSLGIENMCPKGVKVMGAIHIHTRPSLSKDAIPSHTDIKKCIAENMAFFCVGTNVDNRGVVRCFSKEDLETEIIDIIRKDNLEKFEITVEDVDKSARLITGMMTRYKDYLDRHSCQRVYAGK